MYKVSCQDASVGPVPWFDTVQDAEMTCWADATTDAPGARSDVGTRSGVVTRIRVESALSSSISAWASVTSIRTMT